MLGPLSYQRLFKMSGDFKNALHDRPYVVGSSKGNILKLLFIYIEFGQS